MNDVYKHAQENNLPLAPPRSFIGFGVIGSMSIPSVRLTKNPETNTRNEKTLLGSPKNDTVGLQFQSTLDPGGRTNILNTR